MEEEEENKGQEGFEGFPGSQADDEEDDFSFPVVADACVVPVYPIFGRPSSPPPVRKEEEEEPETATLRVPLGRLLLEEREFRARQSGGRSASARARLQVGDEASAGGDDDDDLDGVPPESYCRWAPGGGQSAPASPRRCRKSGSTGSVLRWRRISERLVGRSHSDGKEKFVFLAAPHVPEPPPNSSSSNKEEPEGGGGSKAAAFGGAGLRYYGRGAGAGSRRRSYLPYRQELVGLFANVSGLRRSYHPF